MWWVIRDAFLRRQKSKCNYNGSQPTSTGVTPAELDWEWAMDDLSALCRPVESGDPESKNEFPLVEAATSMRPLSADLPIRTIFTVIPFDTNVGVTLAIHGSLFSSSSLTSRKTPPLAEPPSASSTWEIGIE